MRQDQGVLRCKGGEDVRRLAVVEMVEAALKRLAVDRHMTQTRNGWLALAKSGGMLAEHLLDRGRVELLQNPTDRGVGRSAPPLQAERLAQPDEIDVDEAMDAAIGIGSSEYGQNREQHHMRQPVHLALGAPRIVNFFQHIEKSSASVHGNPRIGFKVAVQGVRFLPACESLPCSCRAD